MEHLSCMEQSMQTLDVLPNHLGVLSHFVQQDRAGDDEG